MWPGLAAQRINFAKAIRLGNGWTNMPDKPGFKREFQKELDTAEGR